MAKALDFILGVMGSSFKQEGDLVTLKAEYKSGRRGRGGGREAGWEATANLKVVQV